MLTVVRVASLWAVLKVREQPFLLIDNKKKGVCLLTWARYHSECVIYPN